MTGLCAVKFYCFLLHVTLFPPSLPNLQFTNHPRIRKYSVDKRITNKYTVKCYIFDIGTVLISRRINKFFSIRNVGNTDLTRVA